MQYRVQCTDRVSAWNEDQSCHPINCFLQLSLALEKDAFGRFGGNMIRTSRRRLRSVGVFLTVALYVEFPGAARGQVDGQRRQRRQLREGMLEPERPGGEQHARDGLHHARRAAQEALERVVEQGHALKTTNNFSHL